MKKREEKIEEIHTLFKTCLNILRNDAGRLIDEEAIQELSYFIFLKQAEKHIQKGSIDIYDLEFYGDGVRKYGKEKFLEYLEYVKFSKLITYVNIPGKKSNIKKFFGDFLWNEVLSKHPKFRDVFQKGKKSLIKDSITIKKIIIALNSIEFNNYDYSILGEAYESLFVDAVFDTDKNKNSELRQFFTPPKVKKVLVNLVNPKLKDTGEIESILNPASGIGGLLNAVIQKEIQWIEMGSVCRFKNGQRITKNKLMDGKYSVVGGGLKPFGKHTQFNVDENTIILSRVGTYAGYVSKYDTKVFVSGNGMYINSFNEKILKDYIYYYLKIALQKELYSLQTGSAQPTIKKEKIETLKIPLISLAKQKQIVDFLNEVNKEVNLVEALKRYSGINIFNLLLNEEFETYNNLIIIAQPFDVKLKNINQIQRVKENLNRLDPEKKTISKILDTESTDNNL